MSQNKYMHPRNIYKIPPNFKELATSYPEFRKFAKQDITGKVTIDFKNQEALRALTTTLLHKDFGLRVEIPLNHLVPALPLRLNYLLWLEDLLHHSVKPREGQTRGVDIGCGASCIYPLLATSMQKWKMLATEIDHESVECARRNVACNDYEDFITVKQVEAGTILKGALDMDDMYDFTMCNPPFFSSEREADSSSKSRSTSRTLPHNGRTGSLSDIVVKGGEVAFILQMIQESAELRYKVKIYSTMVGLKSNFDVLKSELEKAGVASSTHTEFSQGHTTRWGLAWTFLPELNLEMIPKSKKKKKKKNPPAPVKYVVPMPINPLYYNVSAVTNKLEALFTQLQIEYKKLKWKKQSTVFEVTAQRNTWSHQRRKRREKKKHETQQILERNDSHETSASLKREECSISGDAGSSLNGIGFIIPDSSTAAAPLQSQSDMKTMKHKADESSEYGNNNKRLKSGDEGSLPEADDLLDCADQTYKSGLPNSGISKLINQSELYSHSVQSASMKVSQNLKIKASSSDSFEKNKDGERNTEFVQDYVNKNECDITSPESLQNMDDENETSTSLCILKAVVSVSKVGSEICIAMAWLEGTYGRDAVHQVMQYIKNNLRIE